LKALKERGFNVGLALKKGWPAIKNNARARSRKQLALRAREYVERFESKNVWRQKKVKRDKQQ